MNTTDAFICWLLGCATAWLTAVVIRGSMETIEELRIQLDLDTVEANAAESGARREHELALAALRHQQERAMKGVL